MDDSKKETSTPPISEESWLSHFQSLHSNEPLNSHQEAIIDELTRLEDATTQSHHTCITQVTLEVINYTLFIYDRWLFFFHIQFLFNFPACKHRVVVFTGYVNLEID